MVCKEGFEPPVFTRWERSYRPLQHHRRCRLHVMGGWIENGMADAGGIEPPLPVKAGLVVAERPFTTRAHIRVGHAILIYR